MGKITVFSLQTCPHCKRAKQLLTDEGWSFTEISLTDYPEKRADMLKLADRLTVPQIFFNSDHIGGATELGDLFESGGIHAIYQKMESGEAPAAEEFQVPTYPPKPKPVAKETNEETLCIGEACWTYTDLMVLLEKELDLGDRKYGHHTYKNCFVGSEFVQFLQTRFSLKNRAEALQVGQSLFTSGLFHHVLNSHEFEDKKYFYRLQSHSNRKMLNKRRQWVDRIDDPMITVNNCKSMLDKIQDKYTISGLVDYVKIGEDVDFVNFEIAVCEIQRIEITALEESVRLAFTLNLYNLVVSHAFVKVGIPTSNLKRYAFFDRIGYEIGGHAYSLNDIENGILRGNLPPPLHLRKPFSNTDPRLPSMLPRTELTHRIHFALNCGAKSCPPIKKFSPQAVQEELRLAGQAFCEQDGNVHLDAATRTLSVSMILKWYRADFGKDKLSMANTVALYLRGDRQTMLLKWIKEAGDFKIRFIAYDWSSNESNSTKFTPSSQNQERCSLM
eukprot:m.50107 g.50107  ORF g.50107 m.50107 type:complete len:501 (+) comp21213_c0_seq1:199-1701(+)